MGELLRALFVRVVHIFERNQGPRVQPIALLVASVVVDPAPDPAPAPAPAPVGTSAAVPAATAPTGVATLSSFDQLPRTVGRPIAENLDVISLAELIFKQYYGTASFPTGNIDRAVKLRRFKQVFADYFNGKMPWPRFDYLSSEPVAIEIPAELALRGVIFIRLRDVVTGAEDSFSCTEDTNEIICLMKTDNEGLEELRAPVRMRIWYNEVYGRHSSTELPPSIRAFWWTYMRSQSAKGEFCLLRGQIIVDPGSRAKSFQFEFKSTGVNKIHKARLFIDRGMLRLVSEASFTRLATTWAVPAISIPAVISMEGSGSGANRAPTLPASAISARSLTLFNSKLENNAPAEDCSVEGRASVIAVSIVGDPDHSVLEREMRMQIEREMIESLEDRTGRNQHPRIKAIKEAALSRRKLG